MLFNPEESIELNGHTGPFIQYAHARIQSLLAKAGVTENSTLEFNPSDLEPSERDVLKWLTEFPVHMNEAASDLSPAVLANYTYELVKAYNHFYQSVSIMIETDEDKKRMRLALSANVAKVIRQSMRLLGIEVPNRM
jgi:arginyl-tRNA synthetase